MGPKRANPALLTTLVVLANIDIYKCAIFNYWNDLMNLIKLWAQKLLFSVLQKGDVILFNAHLAIL